MKLYSDFARRRTFEILGDAIALVILVVGITVAVSIHGAIFAFTSIGRDVSASGSGFASSMTDIGDSLAGVPLIGGGIRAPFDAARDAGGTLAAAGDSWQAGVGTLAALVGWTIAALVVLVIGLGWIAPRVVGAIRRATVARLASAPASLDLLAFRALARRRPQDVARVDANPIAGWRRGDPAIIRRLAAVELKASGIRMGTDVR